MSQSINSQILEHIKKKRRGQVFFAEDFKHFGTAENVRFVLFSLCKKNILIRLATGIYYYPKIDKKLGLGILYPSWEDVAYAIAKRDKARIVPTGIYALNRLGFSTQVPANFVFLTDGSPRRIKIGKGKGILFKHTAPKNLAFKNELAMLLTFALKEIKKDNVTSEHLERLKYILQQVPKEEILQDVKLMPYWIKDLILKFYD